MRYINSSINISQRSIIIFGWFCISIILVFLDFKKFISFDSVDEELFLTISEADPSIHFIRYIVWGQYLSFLNNVSPLFPINFHLFIFCLGLNIFVKKYNAQKTHLILLLSIPSLMLFSQTYLRDFFILILNIFLFLKVKKDKTEYKSIFIIATIIFLIFILRPIFGVILCFSLISSILIKKVSYSLSYLFLGQFIVLVTLLLIPDVKEMFITEYYHLNTDDVFSLLRIDLVNVSDLAISAGIFFNWVLYYFGINLHMRNYFLLFPFFIESIIYFIFFRSFLFFNKSRFKIDFLYRLSFWLIIFSMIYSTLEADWASVYRHKIFFLPALFYLAATKIKN